MNTELQTLLQTNGCAFESWVYGSRCRPLSGTWFRVPETTLIQASQQETGYYTYVVCSRRLTREEINAYELSLVSRPTPKLAGEQR